MSNCKTTDDFISDARRVHGDKYDYSLVEYKGNKEKVWIICNNLHCFSQTPCDHLRGRGCPHCSGIAKSNTASFINSARMTHCGVYDYSKVEYVNNSTKVKIICDKHGLFLQTPNSHLNGRGCPSCKLEKIAETNRSTNEEFIKNSLAKHGEVYIYDKVSYKGNKTKVTIGCRIHGDFSQTPNNHANGQGCPKCKTFGFNPNRFGYLYFLLSEDGGLIKVGISNDINKRLKQLSKNTPFSFSSIKIERMSGGECQKLERYYHNNFESAKIRGFDGATEWLKYNTRLMNEIMGT